MFKKTRLLIMVFVLVAGLVFPLVDAQANEVITLNYWHYLSGDNAKLHEQMVHEFNAQHPHIQVDILYTGNQFVARDKLLAAVAGSVPPDVALVDQFWPPLMVSTGTLVPLRNFVDPEVYLEDYSQVSKDTVTVHGEAWTVPFSLSNQILLYNKDKFREVGLDPEKPPTTWDELLEYAKILTRDIDGDGRTDEWGLNFTTRANMGSMYAFVTFLWQAGGELYSEDYSEAVFNDQTAVDTVQFWMDLAHKHKVLSLSPPQDGFEIGRIAMQYSSTSSIAATRNKVDFELGVAALPAHKNKVTGVGGSSLAIFKTTPAKQQAAWEFVNWMSSAENNLKWSMNTGYIPLRLSVRDSEVYQQYLKDQPHMQVVMEQSDYARARPNTVSYADLSRILGVAVEEALFGNTNPEPILNNAVKEANTYIKALD
ncbi:MAG TPA: ABC transporter substrate-binding protein [Limnochordia bacterium]|nr:ABC transporter substrate-binding protein [Limnochordia bacterium]